MFLMWRETNQVVAWKSTRIDSFWAIHFVLAYLIQLFRNYFKISIISFLFLYKSMIWKIIPDTLRSINLKKSHL